MPPNKRPLTSQRIRELKRPGLYSDGNGLYVRVDSSGAKRFVQIVTVKGGPRRNLGLGSVDITGLREAREIARANKRMARGGIDPLAVKRRASTPTVAEAAVKVIALNRPTWTNEKHAYQWDQTFRDYVNPVIGSYPVSDVTSGDVLSVLTPIWTSKAETARRVRQRLSTVMDWAVAQGYRPDNPAGMAISRVLPKMPKTGEHLPALHYAEVPNALLRVRESDAYDATKLSFEFLVLTAARSTEVRLARWQEVDWGSKTWTVPAERMKGKKGERRDHRVPLSPRALAVLLEARALDNGSGLIFPSRLTKRPLSNNTHRDRLQDLGIPAVPHGFRSSFKDWAIEQTDAAWAVSEAALAHVIGNATELAYARSDLFDRRRVLMDQWAEYLSGVPDEQGGKR